MKINLLKNLIFLLLASLILVGCGDTNSNVNSEVNNKVEIQLGHHHPSESQVDELAHKLAESANDISNGSIEISVYPGGQLGQELEAIDSVDIGTMDMSIVSPGLMDNYSSLFGIETMPFLFDDWDHADRVLNGEVGEILGEHLLENSSIQLLGYMHLGFRHIITAEKEITGVEDMVSLDVRSPESWVWTRMFDLLEASPTPVTWGEAYSALQTGVVESMESPASGIIDMNFQEVTNHLFLSRHMFGTISLIINEALYEDLTEEQRNNLDEAVVEAIQYMNEVTYNDDVEAIKLLEEEYGMSVTEIKDIEKWREKVEPMYDEYIERVPEAEEIFQLIEAEK